MAESGETQLEGELARAPGPAWATVLYTISGIAFVRGAARVVGRVALAYRRPATLKLGPRGLELSHRTELLGKVLSQGETVVPLANLASVTREVRFARLGLYAGLLALAVGTYIGAGFLVDGVRVPGTSPSLLGMGVTAIALGVVLDYLLAVVLDSVKHTCQIVVRPYHGPALCLRGMDAAEADRVLARIARAASVETDVLTTAETSPSPAPAGADGAVTAANESGG